MENKKCVKILVLIILVTAIFGLSSCGTNNDNIANEKEKGDSEISTNSDSNEVIVFKDPVFEKLIKESLGKEEIYTSYLENYTGLKIAADEFILLSGPNNAEESITLHGEDTFQYKDEKYTGYGTMSSLEDLKYFPKLNNLKVTLQPNIDYSTIPNKEQFNNLSLTQSKISEVSFLSEAVNVMYLDLFSNEIINLTGIENMKQIKLLYVNYNRVDDISALENLTTLENIKFYGNKISDITPIANLTSLEKIGMYENEISDISVLSGLEHLTEVEFINNKITDVSPLKDFDSFKRLALKGNPVENIELLNHIENLEY